MPQEIRNCVYQGRINDLLFELNSTRDWRLLVGAEEDSRMRDMEFILRFFALQPEETNAIDKERISLKKHLNQFMKRNSSASEAEINSFRDCFLNTTKVIAETWGESAFHNISPSDPARLVKKFSPTIFDSLSVATAVAIKKGKGLAQGVPEENRRLLLQDENYRIAISKETMTKESITNRIFLALKYLYGIDHEQ